MAISKKQLKLKLRMLLDRKPSYTQQGRLLGHLLIELGMNSGKSNNGSQIKTLIGECLDELEAEGLVTLVKSGKVYHEVHRTKRQRAIRGSKSSEVKTHGTPHIQLEEESTPMEATVEAVPAETREQVQESAPAGIDIVREAVEAAERYKAQLAEAITAHAVTTATNTELTAAVAAETQKREQAEQDTARYTTALQTANETIEGLNDVVADLTSRLEKATSRTDIEELALRLEALRQ